MTDKEILTIIRVKVEELKSQLIRGACSSQIAMETMCKEEAYNEVLAILDTMQEEPVSEELEDVQQTMIYNGEVYTRCYKDKLDAFACKYPMSVPKTSKKYAKYSDVDLTIAIKAGAKWQKHEDSIVMMANSADAMIGLPYENKDGGYTHLVDVSRPLPVGNNKIAIIFKED